MVGDVETKAPPLEGFQTALELHAKNAVKTAITTTTPNLELAARVSGLEPAMVEVIRRTIGEKLSEPQLLLYLAICKRKGVDPFTEAYAFGDGDGRLAFGLRIDGMRALAMRTGELVSRTVETIFDTSKPPEKFLAGARCTIQRKGMSSPIVEEAWMGEYDRKSGMWGKFPETMIRKVAEAKALRAAFADALSEVYEPAELAKEGG